MVMYRDHRTIPEDTPAVRHDESDRLFAKFVNRPDRRLDYTEAKIAKARGIDDDTMWKLMTRAVEGRLTEGPGAAFAAMKPDLVKRASGAYGQVLVYRATPRVREALRGLRAVAESAGNFVHGERDVPGARVVQGSSVPGLVAVKLEAIAFLVEKHPGQRFDPLRDKVREHVIHAYLSQSACRTAPDGARWCARDVVPELYWAGQLESLNYTITVMEGIDGDRLRDLDATKNLARQMETATHTLWAFGVVHLDLHAGNVVVERATGKLKILDFGRSMYAPRLAGATSPSPSPSPSTPPVSLSRSGSGRTRVYRSSSGRFAPTVTELRSPGLRRRVQVASNEELQNRGFVRYNPDAELMDSLASGLPRTPPSTTRRRALEGFSQLSSSSSSSRRRSARRS